MMRLSRIFAAALVACAALLSAAAPHPVAAAQFIGPSSQTLKLEVGKGRLVRLDRPASSVFIADPAIADIQVKSPVLVYVIGKAAGETTLFAVGDHDKVLLNIGIAVQHNTARLQQALHELLPGRDISVSTVDDSLVLEGSVNSAADAAEVRKVAARFVSDKAQLINKMHVDAPNQVNLRVRIAEMSRQVVKQFGINWESAVRPGSFLFGLATGRPVLNASGQFLTRAPSGGSSSTVNNVFGSYSSGRVDLNTLIDALETEGLVTILAEPNLTATNGELASFLAGGEFPIPVPQDNNNVTIEFKKFGVGLDFVAHIEPSGRINLRVRPEVSELSNTGAIVLNNITIPALTTRRAETTVELASGQSFAIAGLLQNNVVKDLRKFPWLGDVPILGSLFRSDRFQRNETELVIIVTPYLVRPVSSARLKAPTDGYVAPNELERVVGGASYRPQLPPGPAAVIGRNGTRLVGPVGFDLD